MSARCDWPERVDRQSGARRRSRHLQAASTTRISERAHRSDRHQRTDGCARQRNAAV
jgi:hypothetical protein